MPASAALWIGQLSRFGGELLAVTLAAQLVLFVFLGVSIAAPSHRVWPPPSRRSWQFYATWFLSWLTLSGAFLLAVLGGNTLALPAWIRIGAGGPLFAAGAGLLAWGFHALSVHASLGLGGPLVRRGPYRFSRNPQYVAVCAYLASLTLLSGSHLAAIACLAVALWFLATPFAEEPWLAERFGAAYEEYRREVPRDLGLPRSRAG
jgi:protein-S-isoprenylcysteine O-methyltransferase Ste14